MSEVVARRPSFNVYPGPVVFPSLGAILLVVTIYTWRIMGLHALVTEIFIACTALLLLGAVVTLSRYLSYRVTASIGDRGVVLNGREFPFDRIDSVALVEKDRLGDWAKTVALRRTLTIAAEGSAAGSPGWRSWAIR